MALFKFANFVATELEEGISAGATELLVPLAASELLPTLVVGDEEIRLVLWDGQQDPEIVGVTDNPQSGVLTVTRARESTTARAWAAGTQVRCVLTAEIINTALEAFFDIETVLQANFLPLSGGTLTGLLTLSGAPTSSLHAATKAYVDSIGGGFLATTGGTMAGAINMGGNTIVGLGTPATGSAAANKSYVDSAVSSGVKWKDPVRAATTEDGTFSTAFDDGSTIDGVALATGDRILIKDQIDPTENGIYVVQASGAPVRATDADANTEVPGATVFVQEGTVNEATQWTCTNTTVTLGTTEIEFSLIAAGVLYTADENTLQLVGTVFSMKDGGTTFAKLASSAIASQAEAEAGASTTKLITPERATQFHNVAFAAKQASNAEVLAETDVTEFVAPDQIVRNEGVAKAWGSVDSAGNILDSYGVTSVVRDSTGRYTVTLSRTMANANYVVNVESVEATDAFAKAPRASRTTTSFQVRTLDLGGVEGVDLDDEDHQFDFTVFGTLA